MQIGEVAERVGLSLRTIRYYEEVGLVRPSARTTGGFRLYTEPDVARLRLVKRMKTLEFSLEEMGDLLGVLDRLDEPETDPELRTESIERLVTFRVLAQERCADLRSQLETAESFAADLRGEISRQRRRVKEVR
ncbi:MerR family transcriptional regulator [Phytoactinopolyspora mesophila]|uniref:MerR family transcriptional regulator n=1 Tax=Phytoactinopolyspora mesophila TaxID=2650750 RepID=A0A7K3LXG4_9ACTN|nr:MerR family transcriptional regulator [Phytoactinopolyspora mesophila]NDL55703.1 MerR family transcriptional regulator [Phytoactinopolyspora mesophila]